MSQILNLNGRRFHRLIATNQIRRNNSGRIQRLCQCDCGNQNWVNTDNLISGHTKSCGCWKIECRKLEFGQALKNRILREYKRHAQERGLIWQLTDIQFHLLTNKLCCFCGLPPKTIRKADNNNGDLIYNGIDRLDNLQGYTKENTVSCCHTCNRAKSDLPLPDFLAWIKAIKKHKIKLDK